MNNTFPPDTHSLSDPTPAGQDSEAPILWEIVAISFSLGFGLLVGVAALPLHWQPGQLPLLIAVIAVAPVISTFMERQSKDRAGLAAHEFAQRSRIVMAGWLVLLLAGAALGWRVSHSTGSWLNGDVVTSVLVSAALSLFAAATAAMLARNWYQLHPQAWEARPLDPRDGMQLDMERSARLDRGALVGLLWRRWVFGAVLQATALVAGLAGSAQGLHLASPWGLLSFVAYLGLGPQLIGQAMRLRWQTQWQLERLSVAPEVQERWGREAVALVLATLAATGLSLALGVLDLAHLVVVQISRALVPLLNALLALLGRISNSSPPRIPPPFQQPIPRHPSAPPPAHLPITSTGGFWLWLAHEWPYLLGLCLLVATLLIWRAREAPLQRGAWRALFATLLTELRALWPLLWRPARRLLARPPGMALAEAAGARLRRSTGRPSTSDRSPRGAIIALYLGMLRAADRRGYSHRPGQTPREFAEATSGSLPELHDDLRGMTDLFMHARYAEQPVEPEQVARVQALWQSLRALLRHAPRAKP